MSLTRAAALLDKGKFRDAHTMLEPLAAGGGEDALLLLARAQHHRHLFRSAEDTLRTVPRPHSFAVNLLRGVNAVHRARLAQAMDILERALPNAERELDRARAMSWLARAERAAGRERRARMHLDQALQLHTGDAWVYLNAGEIALQEFDFELADRWGMEALTAAPHWPETHLFIANLRMLQDRFDVARAKAEHAVKLGPEFIYGHLLLGEIAAGLRQWPDAAEHFLRAAELSPQGACGDYGFVQAANAFYRTGQIDRCRAAFQRCVDLVESGPLRDEAELFLERLRDARVAGTPVLIEEFPTEVQKTDFCGPANLVNLLQFWRTDATQDEIAEALFENGVATWKMGAYARQRGLHAVSFTGDDDTLKMLLDLRIPVLCDEYDGLDGHYVTLIGYDTVKGVFHIQDSNFKQPVEVDIGEFRRRRAFSHRWACVIVPAEQATFLEDLKLPDTTVVKLFEEAERHLDAGKLDGAAELARGALKLLPAYTPAFRLIIKTDILRRDWNGASARLRKWLERHPRSFWGNKYLADCYHELGNHYLAAKFYRQAHALYPKDYSTTALLGKSCLELEEFEEARKYLHQALSIDPSQAWAYVYLGEFAASQGRQRDAIANYRIALELDDRYTFLTERIAQMQSPASPAEPTEGTSDKP